MKFVRSTWNERLQAKIVVTKCAQAFLIRSVKSFTGLEKLSQRQT